MKMRPNETSFVGAVTAVRPAGDKIGFEVRLEIEAVTTPPESDFIGLLPGSAREFYLPGTPHLTVGARYACTATMLGGPGGERAVLRTARIKRR
jgi:hypothetical protein